MLTPKQIAKSSTEHAALFAYCAVAYWRGFDEADAWCKTGELAPLQPGATPKVPGLEWFHAIHNQGHGDKIRGAHAKAEGVRKGVADTFLPWPIICQKGAFAGLYIEMKKPSERPKRIDSSGGLSEDQKRFGEYAQRVGYVWRCCYGWEHAVSTIRSYLELNP
jgi:hypothetical protein